MMLEELRVESKKADLCINAKKKHFNIQPAKKTQIVVEGGRVRVARETIYLGQVISLQGNIKKEIARRRGNTCKSFWAVIYTFE